MRKDLREGFELAEMARGIVWGRIVTAPYLCERYISVKALGIAALFVRAHYLSPPPWRVHRMHWWRGWIQRCPR